jgi:hypothetical protein
LRAQYLFAQLSLLDRESVASLGFAENIKFKSGDFMKVKINIAISLIKK